MNRAVLGWAGAGGIAFAILPWYATEDGIFSLGWLSKYPLDRAAGPVVALVVVFVFYPVSRVLVGAVLDNSGAFAPREFWTKLSAREVWGLDCLVSSAGCGVAWNTVLLGVLVAASSTALGLAFALIVTRTEFRAKKALRVLTVLPVITPPFVIGLAVILLFGRAGAVTTFAEWALGIPASRWIYGLPGVWLAQVLAFTP